MDKKSSSTTERFSVTDADNFLGEMSQPSTQLLAELIDYLRARGDAQDAGLAQALESQGWSVLTTAQIQMLLLQFKALAQADALQLAQADANATQGAAPTTDGAPSSSALSELKPITTETKDAAPAPANYSAPTPSFAGQIMELLSRSDLVAPANSVQISGPESSPSASNPGTPTLGSAILSSLAAGQLPGVSAATVVQSNAGAPLSVPGVQTPQVAAPTTAPITSAVSTLLASAAGTSSGPSSSTSSNVAVSRMPASASLGASAELSNAASITPYVEQKVSTTGSLVSAPIVPGSTETGNTKTTTSYVRPNTAEVLGGVLSVARVVEKITPPTVEAPRPPDPFGNVSIGFHKSMLLTSEGQDGGGTNLNLPRTIYEGTSNSGSTPVNLVVSRANPLMPDDIGFVITGLNGLVDVTNIFYGDTEINQSLVTITVDADGTIRGLVHFEGGETDKVLTLHIRQDGTIESDEPARIVLDDTHSLYSLTDPRHASATILIANDDFLKVSIEATGAAIWEGNDSDPKDDTVETNDLTFTVTRRKPLGMDDSEGWPAEDIPWSLPDPNRQIVLDAGMTRDPVTGVVSGVVRFAAIPRGSESQSTLLVLHTERNGAQEADWRAVVTLEDSDVSHVDQTAGNAGTWILDDDPTIAVDPTPPTVLEGGDLVFTISRSTALDTAFDVDFQLVPTSGGAGYILQPKYSTVHFAAGQATAEVRVRTDNDAIVNDPRHVALNITGVSNLEDENGNALTGRVYVAAGSSVGSITNDDAEISIDSITADPVPDADGMVNFTVIVSRDGETAFQHGVKLTIVGVGENPLDPTEVVDTTDSRDLIFEANGENTLTFTFKVPAGMIIDGSRTFEVQLQDFDDSDLNGDVIAERTALGVDAARGAVIPNGVSVSVVPVLTNLAEGSVVGAAHTFAVRLSEAAKEDIEIGWYVRGYGLGTAADSSGPSDFVNAQFPKGTFTIFAGEVEKTFQFTPNADASLELTEKFLVDIDVVSGPAGVVGVAARGSIINDDAVIGFENPNMVFVSAEGPEGVDGTVTVQVARDGFIRSNVTVAWHLEPAEGADAASLSDLFGDPSTWPSGVLEIAAGQRYGNIEIKLHGDNAMELSERFRVVLEDGTVTGGAELGANREAFGVIANDDAVFKMGATTVSTPEGHNAVKTVTVTVVREATEGSMLSTADVSWVALPAGTGADYATSADFAANKFPSGTLRFVGDLRTAEISFQIKADAVLENNESFVVNLTGTPTLQHRLSDVAAELSATVTISNDDDLIAFAPDAFNLNQAVSEDGVNHTGQTLTYQLTRSGDSSKVTSVNWHLNFAGGQSSASASDFLDGSGLAYVDGDTVSGTATFAAGSNVATLRLFVRKDIQVEDANEGFSVVLDNTNLASNGSALALTNTTATGVLTNDDVRIVATLSGGPLEANLGGFTTYTYQISRQGDLSQASSIAWSVVGAEIANSSNKTLAGALSDAEISSTAVDGGTASAEQSGVLNWAANDNAVHTVTVTVAGDALDERDEAFELLLSNHNPQLHASELIANGLKALVNDNDAKVGIYAMPLQSSVIEGAQGTSKTVTYELVRTGDLSQPLTVNLLTSGSTTGISGPSQVFFDSATSETVTLSFNDGRPDQVFNLRGDSQRVQVTFTVAGDDVVEIGEKLIVSIADFGAVAPGHNVVVDSANASVETLITNDDVRITTSTTAVQDPDLQARAQDEGVTSLIPANTDNTVTYTLTRTGDLSEKDVTWKIVGRGDFVVNAEDFKTDQENLSVPNGGLPSGLIRFAQGQSTATVILHLQGDLDIEPNEGMALQLTAAGGNVQFDSLDDDIVYIKADDKGYGVSARAGQVTEGNDSTQVRNITFDVTAIGAGSTTVWWKVTGIDGQDVVDGQVLQGSLSFTSAITSRSVSLAVLQDAIVDSDKTATITLYTNDNYDKVLQQNQVDLVASTELIDDDAEVSVTALVGSAYEGSDPLPTTADTPDSQGLSADYITLKFDVNRAGMLNQTSLVPWSIALTGGLTIEDFSGNFPTEETGSGWYDQSTQSIKGWVTFAVNETAHNIQLNVRSEWLKESNENVTVQLGTPTTAGTSLKDDRLVDGSDKATTTVLNDDAAVQFVAGSLHVTHVEGNANISGPGYVDFTFDLVRDGNLGLTSTINWILSGADITASDFLNHSGYASTNYTNGLPYGTVTFGANDTSKTITVRVNSDDFVKNTSWNSPSSIGQSLEGDETFKVTLNNGTPHYNGPYQPWTVTESVGTSIGANREAQGAIINDDVQIQITSIRTNLPEGTAPDVNGDVNPSREGVQHYIEQAITFERQGDPSQQVSFSWKITGAGADKFYSDGSTFKGVVLADRAVALVNGEFDLSAATVSVASVNANEVSGTITWAAGDAGTKTLIFRPTGNDDVGGFDFSLVTTANNALIDEFTSGSSDSSVINREINESKTLASFAVERDEAGVWLSSQVLEQYDPWTSQLQILDQQYRAGDYVEPFSPARTPVTAFDPGLGHSPWDTSYDGNSPEGSMGVAVAGVDYTNTSGTLTFSYTNTTQSFTVHVKNDGTYETSEGVGIYLSGVQGANLADDQGSVVIRDDDGPAVQALRVFGNTAIEGLDANAQFTIDLGKSVGRTTEITVDLDTNQGTAAVSKTDGQAGDYTRYFEYSTDGGNSWQTNAPVFDFNYTAPRVQQVDDQLTVAYSFDNGQNNNSASWDSWLEFSDLKTGTVGQRVGNTLQGASHGDGGGGAQRLDVVVGSEGAWIDSDGDRVWDNAEDMAFDWNGNDNVGLSDNAVSITFIDVHGGSPLNLSGFGLDDRIYIDKLRFEDNGYSSCGGTHYVQDANGSGGFWRYEWYKGYTSGGEGGLSDSTAIAVGQDSGRDLYAFGCCSGSSSTSDQLGYNLGSDANLSQAELFNLVSFVNVGNADQPLPQVLHQQIWVAVRADALVQASDLTVQMAGSGSEMMEGQVGGVLDLANVSSADDLALRGEFLNWWNSQSGFSYYAPESDSDWTQFSQAVQGYFDQFAARLTDGPAVKFVQVNIDWDGYGQMSWSLDGLDPAAVLAPQNNGPFSHLQLLQDITVDAGNTTASADVHLGAQAIFDTDNSMSAVAALESTGLQPSFTVTNDSIDANGIRTVTVSVDRSAGLGEDVVSYHLNMGDLVDSARLLPGSARLDGSLAFAEEQTHAELTFQFNARIESNDMKVLPAKVNVIVDHYLVDGTDAGVGAFIDLDKDGVLDANEAVTSNRAFDTDGNDLIGVNTHKVTITFNDFTSQPLDLSGFGGDDRIQINLDELSRYWRVGTVTEYSLTSSETYTIRDGSAETEWTISGRTPQGRDFSFSMNAHRSSFSSSTTATFTFQGDRWTVDGNSEEDTITFAHFGYGEGQNPIIDGYFSLASQVSFVKNPTVYVVVDHYLNADGQDVVGAFVDLDKDGVLDSNEALADNLAFNADGSEAKVELRHAPVVLHFNDAPTEALDLRNFGLDDRIEIDVAAFKEHGWNLPAADVQPRQNWEFLSGLSGDGAAALVYSPESGAAQDWFGVQGFYNSCSNMVFSNHISMSNVVEGIHQSSQQLGNFGTKMHTSGQHNGIVQNDAIWGRISFVNIDSDSTRPAQDVHVVVNALGAFIDLDKDGVLDGDEATNDNKAFNEDGAVNTSLVNFHADHVTVTFNDAPTQALDFAGFGADDRVQINLNQLSANGWLIPDKLTSDEMSRSDACTSHDISGYMSTRSGDFVSLTLRATRNGTDRWLELEGDKRTSEGSTSTTIRLANFSEQFPLIGRGELLNQQVSFVRDPQVHVVIDKGAAYFDLDADGKLDANEYNDDNFAFDGEGNPMGGLDLAYQSVTIRFNDYADSTLNLAGFGRDDRIEIDLGKLGKLDAGQALHLDRSYSTSSNTNDSWWDNSSSYGTSAWAQRSSEYNWQNGSNSHNLSFSNYQEAGSAVVNGTQRYYQSHTNKMRLDGSTLAHFGTSSRGSRTVTSNDVNHNPFSLIDANGGMLNRVSFVNSLDPQVLIKAEGGWLDLNHDGLLQDAEQTDANRAFAADGTALIDLAADAYTLRFIDAPDQRLDFSGFDFNDRIELDLTQFAVRGHLGADLSQNAVAGMQTKSFPWGTSAHASSSNSPRMVGLFAGHASEDAFGVYFQTKSWSDSQSWNLADFGDNTEAVGYGQLANGDRLSFVNSTVRVVVDGNGAFLDENGNGKLDESESISVFDPISGEASIDLSHQKVVITFNGVPETPLDLSNFDEDDRIDINRSAFHSAGWAGANAQTTIGDSNSKGFRGANNSGTILVSQSYSELHIMAGYGFPSTKAVLANFGGEGELNWSDVMSHVSFVQDNLITGFVGDHAISLQQGGSLSSGGMQYTNTIKVDPGTNQVQVRVPVVDDHIDEQVENIHVTVSTDDSTFVVPQGNANIKLVDNDSPQITTDAVTLWDNQLGQAYVVQVVDINNRNGDTPQLGYEGSPGNYYSNSLLHDAGAAQSFTITVKLKGDWQAALVTDNYNGGYDASNTSTSNVNAHLSPPAFRTLSGVDELVDDVATGWQLVQIQVAAGTQQVLLRQPIEQSVYNQIGAYDLVAGMSIDVTHVDPVVVVRDVVVDESAGTATVNVVAVGGDAANPVTVNYGTRDGQWEERLFLVSREFASAGTTTVSWSVEALGGQGQANLQDSSGYEYITGYAGHQAIQSVTADDFALLEGQHAGVGQLPAGTVTFADGQKEAYIRVAVRTDNVGEEREDFRVVLNNVPKGVQLLPNPDAPATYNALNSAGYATIANDDQLFFVKGAVFKEHIHSTTNGEGNPYQAQGGGLALTGLPAGMSPPTGYTLHQFVIERDGDALAPASVDWVLRINGIDGAGPFDAKLNGASQAAGAHAMETADFLGYVQEDGAYNQALGLDWTSGNGGFTSLAKTVVFNAGESYKVVTIAIKDDALAEDAEQFTVALSNPHALPGNDGNPGVSALRGEALFVVGDNDGSKVSVALNWLQSKDGTEQNLENGLGRTADVNNAVYEGTGTDWLSAGSDNNLAGTDSTNDHRLQITFTRSHRDETASQAYFEINLGQQNRSYNTWVLESGEASGSVVDVSYGNTHQWLWRGTVNFDALATEANVVFRVPDDNMVEGDQPISVTLYDAEHLPQSDWGWRRGEFNAGVAVKDAAGIGQAQNLPDWNTTVRHPTDYTATATVVDDDVRLWLGNFQTYSTSHDYVYTPGLTEYDADADFDAATALGSDPAFGNQNNQVKVTHNGDVEVNFSRAGVQTGDIVLHWQVLLGNQVNSATESDFNALSGDITISGAQGTSLTTSYSTVIENLLKADRVVENNETFQLKFTVLSIDNQVVGSASNVLFTPDYVNEATGADHHNANLAGQNELIANVVIRNDDVTYGLSWAGNSSHPLVSVSGADATVTEGNPGGSNRVDFVVSRQLGVDNNQGFMDSSSVYWRVVPVSGSLKMVDASDFEGGTMGGRVDFNAWNNAWNSNATAPATVTVSDDGVARRSDLQQLVSLWINADSKVEYGEDFTIELYDPSVGYVNPTASTLTATIVNDDTGIILNDFTVVEGADGTTTAVQATVLRVGDLTDTSTVLWNEYNVDTQGNDWDANSVYSGSFNMSGTTGATVVQSMVDGFGVQKQVITLTGANAAQLLVQGDSKLELEEQFRIKLGKGDGVDALLLGNAADVQDGDTTDDTIAALQSATFVLDAVDEGAGQAMVSVVNDDTVFSVVSTASYTNVVEEGTDGETQTYHFTISRSVAVPQAQTVTWSVVSAGGRNLAVISDFGGSLSLPSSTVTWAAGDTSLTKDITFTVAGDTFPEADEVFTVNVTAYGAGAIGQTPVVASATVGAKGVIVNDDSAVFISDGQPIVQVEGSSANPVYKFDVVRSGPAPTSENYQAMVDWEVVFDGGGANYQDFIGLTSTQVPHGTLTFNGNGMQTVEIAINPDLVSEMATQGFSIRLKNAFNMSIVDADPQGVGPSMSAELGDDDFTLSVAQATNLQAEDYGLETDGRGTIAFVVTRDGSNALPANVTWTINLGSGEAAAIAADFRDISDSKDNDGVISGNFVLPAGADSYTFHVPVRGDVQWEENETFTVDLSYDRNNGSAAGVTSAAGSIVNDDEGFYIEFENASVNEGAGPMRFRIVREGDQSGSSSVNWTLAGETATTEAVSGNPSDFNGAMLTGTVHSVDFSEISPSANNQQRTASAWIEVPLEDESRYEANETFSVSLSNPSEGSSIKTESATATIVNDDMGYWIAVDTGTVTEGDSTDSSTGTRLVYTITRSSNVDGLASSSSVRWAISTVSGDTNAVQAGDFAEGLSGVATFEPGATSTTVIIHVVGDGLREDLATLRMKLTTSDDGGTLVQDTADTVLTDDDSTVALVSSGTQAGTEGNTETEVTSYFYDVERSGSSLGDAVVNWSVSGTGDHPVTESDIHSVWVWEHGLAKQISTEAFASGQITFADADSEVRQIEVRIKQDRLGEYDEQFTVSIDPASYGTNVSDGGLAQTVGNDDPVLMLSMTNTSILEGNDPESGSAFTFLVTRGGDTTLTSTVQWNIEAVSNSLDETDFGGLFPGGMVIFAPGQTQKYVTVLTAGDLDVEGNEDFKIVLHDEINATVLGDSSVQATIVDDDVAISVRSVSSTVVEGVDGSEVDFRFAVQASGAPASATYVTVSWHIEGISIHPTIGNDFLEGKLPRGETTIQLSRGQGYEFIDIAVAGDNVFGPDEQFKIVIDDVAAYAGSTPLGASAVIKEATAMVLDDDLLIGLVQSSPVVDEGVDGDTTVLRFYVEDLGSSYLSPTLDQVRVDFRVSGVVNEDDFDGSLLSGTNVALQQDGDGYYLELVVKGDTEIEDHEQFKLQIDRAYSVNSGGNVEVAAQQSFVSGRIQGDDYGIQLAAVSTAQNEDSARFNFELIRLGPIDVAMDILVQVGAPAGDTGSDMVSRDDFINLSGFTLVDGVLNKTVHFEANQGTARFELEADHDLRSEGHERFTVMASVDAVNDNAVTPTLAEVSSIDCTIYDESSDMLAASSDPILEPVFDHHG